MDFYSTIKPSASTIRSPVHANKDERIAPYIEEVIILVDECGVKHPRRKLIDKREQYLRHDLFPSRCSPRSSKTALKTTSKFKPAPARDTDGNGSLAFTNNGASTTTTATSTATATSATISPPKRYRRHTLHRRSRHVFVPSHSPSSPSPAPRLSALPGLKIFRSTGGFDINKLGSSTSTSSTKTNCTRRHHHHRRHNRALNAMEFDILLRGFVM